MLFLSAFFRDIDRYSTEKFHSEPSTGEDGESGVQQVRRNQATAIILLGVVGAEFGDELNR